MRVDTATFLALIAIGLASCASSTPGQASGSYHFKDTVDGGNDALTAGCHVEYLSNACNARQVLGVRGDSCLSEKTINEYTNNVSCHEHDANTAPADLSSLNCDEVCGSRGGKCEVVKNACAVATVSSDSARCVCNEK